MPEACQWRGEASEMMCVEWTCDMDLDMDFDSPAKANRQRHSRILCAEMDIRLSDNVTTLSGHPAQLECLVKSSVSVSISVRPDLCAAARCSNSQSELRAHVRCDSDSFSDSSLALSLFGVCCAQWMRKGRAARGTGDESLPAMLSVERGGQYYSLHQQHDFSSVEAAASTGDRRLSIVGFLRPEDTSDFGHVYVSRLRVEGAQVADQGEYLCVAQSHKLPSHFAKSATTLRVIVGAPLPLPSSYSFSFSLSPPTSFRSLSRSPRCSRLWRVLNVALACLRGRLH